MQSFRSFVFVAGIGFLSCVALSAQESKPLNSFRFVDIVPGYVAPGNGPDVRLQRSLGLLPATYYPEQGEVYLVTYNPDTIPEQTVAIRMLNSTYRVDSAGPERREIYASLTYRPEITPRIARYLLECSEAVPLLHYSFNQRSGEYFLTAEVPAVIDTTTLHKILVLVGSEAFIRALTLKSDSLEQGVHPQIADMFRMNNRETADDRVLKALSVAGVNHRPMPRGVFEIGFIDNLRPEPILLYTESSTLWLGDVEFRNVYALVAGMPDDESANAACIPLLAFNEDPLKFGNLSIAAAGNGSASALYLNAYVPADCSPQHFHTFLQRLAGQAASVRNYLAH